MQDHSQGGYTRIEITSRDRGLLVIITDVKKRFIRKWLFRFTRYSHILSIKRKNFFFPFWGRNEPFQVTCVGGYKIIEFKFPFFFLMVNVFRAWLRYVPLVREVWRASAETRSVPTLAAAPPWTRLGRNLAPARKLKKTGNVNDSGDKRRKVRA